MTDTLVSVFQCTSFTLGASEEVVRQKDISAYLSFAQFCPRQKFKGYPDDWRYSSDKALDVFL